MKKYCIILVSLILILAMILGGCASSTPSPSASSSSSPSAKAASSPSSTQASTKTTELSFNLAIPPTHTRWVQLLKPWVDELNNRMGGKVVVKPYFAEALSPQAQNYQSVVNGIADMAENTMDSSLGQFPLMGTIFYLSTPSVYVSNKTQLVTDLLTAFPNLQQELKGVKVLGLEGSTHNNIGTSKKVIGTLADMKGLKLNVIGGGLAADKLKALGMSVEGLAQADVYTSLDKGVVDGTLCSMDILIGRKWADIVKQVNPVNMSAGTFYFVMNQQRFDSLPPDIQKIINDMAGSYFDGVNSQFWNNSDVNEFKTWTGMGGKITHFSATDLAAVDKAVQVPVQAFVSGLDSKGIQGTQIYQKYLELEKKYSAPWPY